MSCFTCTSLACAAHVESRHHPDSDKQYRQLFVFGDSFADTGNLEKDELSKSTRNWYYPTDRISDSNHSYNPTDRFSNGRVQSDFIAMLIGRDESPAAERLREQDGVDPFGMNFAVAGAGVNDEHAPNLAEQINLFRKHVKHGVIDDDLSRSVALVAISGFDYSDIPDEDTDYDNFVSFIGGVTDEIADGVRRIQELGVTKVLVNLLHPMGCTPWNTRVNNYTECVRDTATDLHNKDLKRKLGSEDSVLLLDLNTVFTDIISPKRRKDSYVRVLTTGTRSAVRALPRAGTAGSTSTCGNPQFWMCGKPHKYFYWDEWHPTQAGWRAVMEELEGSIKKFLGICSC